ncbi:MAG: hypothetical protein HQL60_03185 [Magnetococcales bacterium]|nr:hypothetical protein [Magnetococcales bacterium]
MGRTPKVIRDASGRCCCPHCQQVLLRWAAAQHDFEDGLGFGVLEMLVCFNNQCPMYVKGWNSLFENYGRIGSVRYYYSPDDGDEGVLPIAHGDALRGDIVGEQSPQ